MKKYRPNAWDRVTAYWEWWRYYDVYEHPDGRTEAVGDDCTVTHPFDALQEVLRWCNEQPGSCAVCVVRGS